MYKPRKLQNTNLKVNKSKEGEMIEKKIDRLVNNGEPIKEKNVTLTYQKREDGINPDYDIRTDKMEHALEAMDKASMSHRGKRNQRIADSKKNMKIEEKGATTKESGETPAATNDPS